MRGCELATQTVDQLLSAEDCDCGSHELIDNRDRCEHCGAGSAQFCDEACPVGEIVRREAEEARRTAWPWWWQR